MGTLVKFMCLNHVYNLSSAEIQPRTKTVNQLIEVFRQKGANKDALLREVYLTQKARWEYATTILKVKRDNEPNCWNDFFAYQGYTDKESIANSLYRVLSFKNLRKNTIMIIGPPQTGKTMFINALSRPFNCGVISKIALNKSNNFVFEPCINKGMILIEEPIFTKAVAADMLNLFAGDELQVEKKYDTHQTVSKTPILVSSNDLEFGRGFLPETMEAALRSRCVILYFNNTFTPTQYFSSKDLYRFIMSNKSVDE